MIPCHSEHRPIFLHSLAASVILLVVFLSVLGCADSQTVVRKSTQTITQTTRDVGRKTVLSDGDLKQKIGILKFENNTLQKNQNFQDIFDTGLPEYLTNKCPEMIVQNAAAGDSLNILTEPPKLESGLIDGFALAILGRQLGLNAIVTGSLEDIRSIEDLQGILWTKQTQHLVQIFIRVEVFDTRTATKILDNTFDRQIEVDELDGQMIQDSEQIQLPELNETMNLLLIDIGDRICDAVWDQPWDGFITEIDGDRYVVPAGKEVGLKTGDILEVFDSSRIVEGTGGQRFFIPGLKIGRIEIVTITENSLEAKLIEGKDIRTGSTVRRE
jgi:hypothetical protein